MSTPEHVDVLVVGAGLSGIGAACRLSVEHPGRSVAVLESRDVSGGTWDVFRYPGIRSDSDMFTFGYHWRPWEGDRALADGPMILDYLRTVAREYDVDRLDPLPAPRRRLPTGTPRTPAGGSRSTTTARPCT